MRYSPYCRVFAVLMFAAAARTAPASTAQPASAPAPAADPYADNACVNCHRDLPGRSSEIVELEWKHSVHFAAKTPCNGCHGGNPSVKIEQFASKEELKKASHLMRDPQFFRMYRKGGASVSPARGRSVSYFCGKCHSEIMEKHLGSSHGAFGKPTCLYCHGGGSHKITPASSKIIDTRGRKDDGQCSPCHKAATMEGVAQLKKIIVDTEERIEASGKLYTELEEWSYHNIQLEQLHHHAASKHSQLRQIFHSFNMRDISTFAAEITEVTDRTVETHELIKRMRSEQRQQTIIGVVMVSMLLIFASLLVYYKNTFLEEAHAVDA